MAITKFGQYVLLVVVDEAGDSVLATDDLRIDFEIFHINGYSRAKVDIFNLAAKTVKTISNGKVKVILYTILHGGKRKLMIDSYTVNNALEETLLPEKKLSLFCSSQIHTRDLQNQVSVQVKEPSLFNIIRDCAADAKFTGRIRYENWPNKKQERIPPNPVSNQKGSFINILARLSLEYNFNYYTETAGYGIVILYKPEDEDIEAAGTFDNAQKDPDILLDVRNMRANPKVGPAQLQITSNLEPEIKPGRVLDTSNLLTAGTSLDQQVLEDAGGVLRDTVAGSGKYIALTVIHNGSNWTGQWQTRAMAYTPTKGNTMSTDSNKWWIN